MNEYSIIKKSIKVAIVGLLIFSIASLLTKEINFIFGFLLGYAINLVTFLIIIQSSTTILNLRGGAVAIVIGMFMIKLLVYALGFLLAVKLPNIFSIISVFVGYFMIKITIYINGYINKGGELKQ